jgi:isopenicillin N synthase-like dioxygenase
MLRRLYEFSIQNYLEPNLVDRKFEQLAEIFDLPEEFKTQISELTQTIPSAPPMSESSEILPEVQTLGHIEDSEPDDFEPVQMVNSDALNALAQSSSHFEAFDPDAWSEIPDYESEASEASEVSEVEEEERP